MHFECGQCPLKVFAEIQQPKHQQMLNRCMCVRWCIYASTVKNMQNHTALLNRKTLCTLSHWKNENNETNIVQRKYWIEFIDWLCSMRVKYSQYTSNPSLMSHYHIQSAKICVFLLCSTMQTKFTEKNHPNGISSVMNVNLMLWYPFFCIK